MQNFDEKKAIESYEKWFQLYTLIPIFAAALTFFFFVVFGFIDCFAEITDMAFELEFGVIFLWALLGIPFAAISYFLYKVLLAYRILHLAYLKKIALNDISLNNMEEKHSEEYVKH